MRERRRAVKGGDGNTRNRFNGIIITIILKRGEDDEATTCNMP